MADSNGPLVVGYDSSPDADWAVDWAAVEAVRRGRSLIVLFAADLPRLTGPDITMGHQGDHAQEMAEAVAQAGVKRARAAAPEVAVEARITRLGAAVALIEASVDASLLVVGGRGRLRLSEALLGTVQFAVTAHAQCPVVVVPPECDVVPDSEHPVVVGVDGSQDSKRAVRVAAEGAAQRGVSLIVVGAWQQPPTCDWSRFYVVDDQWRDEILAAARGSATQNVTDAAQNIRAEYADLDVHELVVEGRPSMVLAEESVNAGLVVVGARGRNDMVTLMFGSVGRNLIHSTHCPVQVIRGYTAHSAGPRTSVTTAEAEMVADEIGINFADVEFDLDQFQQGIVVELEHGTVDTATNVTDDDLVVTAKIAWAHLNEFADYYTRLAVMEAQAHAESS
ncbi:MAG: DUF5661 family protein [Ornithinimicrobium sp.]